MATKIELLKKKREALIHEMNETEKSIKRAESLQREKLIRDIDSKIQSHENQITQLKKKRINVLSNIIQVSMPLQNMPFQNQPRKELVLEIK